MKMSAIQILFLALTAFLVQSCYSPKFMVDDDVYVMKNSMIQVGESTSDETSYASYRKQRDNRAVSSHFYNDDLFMNPHFRPRFWHMGFGMNSMFYRPGFGHMSSFGFPYYSPYMYGGINPIYLVDPFGSPYGFYPTAFDPWLYGHNGFYGNSYWNNNGWNNNGWNNNGNVGNPVIHHNHHSGPRGSLSGIGNPGGRSSGAPVIKSVQNPNSNSFSQNSLSDVRQKRIDNTSNVGQSIRESSTTKPTAPVTVQSIRQNRLTPTTDRNIRPSGVSVTTSPSRPGINNAGTPSRNNSTPVRMENPGLRGNDVRPSGSGSSGGSGRSGGAPASGGGSRRN
jgi:hypothetical protein